MSVDWSSACTAALELNIRSRKDIAIASCGGVSAALSVVFFSSSFLFFCHRRYTRAVAQVDKGYWKHYGPFTLFTAVGSLASANAWAFQLKSLESALDAAEVPSTADGVASKYMFLSHSYALAVVFQTLCENPLPHSCFSQHAFMDNY
jgi:hypothetical protein